MQELGLSFLHSLTEASPQLQFPPGAPASAGGPAAKPLLHRC